MFNKATKPLEAKIKELKTQLDDLVDGQNFISDKHNKMANDYKSVLTKARNKNKKLTS